MKHPRAEMIIEWANDTSKQLQIRDINNGKYYNCIIQDVILGNEIDEFRFKPREFNEGEWYQVVRKWDSYTEHLVIPFFKGEFHFDNESYDAEQFDWIGESLGKLKFG